MDRRYAIRPQAVTVDFCAHKVLAKLLEGTSSLVLNNPRDASTEVTDRRSFDDDVAPQESTAAAARVHIRLGITGRRAGERSPRQRDSAGDVATSSTWACCTTTASGRPVACDCGGRDRAASAETGPVNLPPRLATMSDRDAVEAITAAAYAPWIPRVGRPPGPMRDDHAALIRDGRVHVVERDGAVRGVLVVIPDDDALLLHRVAVPPAPPGRGLGRALSRHAEPGARAAGLAAVRLATNVAMAENIALYARLGFVETHRGEQRGFRRVFMRKMVGEGG